jgi:polysaccharide deacetylase family protein (PEP-CTERM system associated)
VVRGYRAPSFSITRDAQWAFTILVELGFTFDSSIFPVKHPNYGVPDAPRFPFRVETASGTLVEFPMPTLSVGRRRSPFGGGAYLRVLPYAYTHWAIQHTNEQEQWPVCVYLHPWELDPQQPRMRGGVTAQLRHYLGLGSTEPKLRKLLRDFQFVPMASLLTDFKQDDIPVLTDSEVIFASPDTDGTHLSAQSASF